MPSPVVKSAFVLLSLLAPALSWGLELYRYENDKGVVVIDRLGVPPEFIAKGYEVLNEQGRVIRVVAPAPTLEERQRLAVEAARAKSDTQLRRLYSTPEDIERARDRKLKEQDSAIKMVESNVASLHYQQTSVQRQAAEHERAGRAVPAELLEQLRELADQQKALERNIARLQQERRQQQASFDADRDRLRELLSR